MCKWWKIDFGVGCRNTRSRVVLSILLLDVLTQLPPPQANLTYEKSKKREDVERSADKDMNVPPLGHKMAQ